MPDQTVQADFNELHFILIVLKLIEIPRSWSVKVLVQKNWDCATEIWFRNKIIQQNSISALTKGALPPHGNTVLIMRLYSRGAATQFYRKIRFWVRLNFQSQFTFPITYLLFASQD